MNDVYINRIEKYLPNEPVSNDEMEKKLGLVNGNISKSRRLVLSNNGIKNRYYALDKSGNITHSNAQLSKQALIKLFDDTIRFSDVGLLTTGTSSPDALQPSHALLVHGEMGGDHNLETMSVQGTCNAGMLSLKYAYLSILAGQCSNAVNVASETVSSWFKAGNYVSEIDRRKEIEENPYIAFEKDFLRWMLSDGAVATLLQNKPNSEGISLKVDWIDVLSFANELDTCMYAGCAKQADGSLTGWRELSVNERDRISVFSVKQDAKLLQKNIIKKGVEHLRKVIKEKKLVSSSIDHFLPHLSSMFFKQQVVDGLESVGLDIPESKWFTNLPEIGNVGAASGMLLVEELFNSGNLQSGEKIFMMVPESAKFSYTYAMLTVV